MSRRSGPPRSRAVLRASFVAAALCAAAAATPTGLSSDAPSPAASAGLDASRFTVVVNASRPGTLKRRQVADLFLRLAPRWPDGTPVAVVDLSVNNPTRAAFSKVVLEQSTAAVVHHWQRQMLTGRLVPPVVKSQDALLAFVASTPGGIGYVAPDATLPEGVKVVKLVE